MKKFFKMDENKLITSFFVFSLLTMILCAMVLLNINHQIEIGNIKNKQLEIEKKDKTITCIKSQLYCYNENKTMTENEIIKICGNIDHCENP
jgi:hypothetical protein